MIKLLWLCTIALGVRMLYEMTYDFGQAGERMRRALYWVAIAWVGYAGYVALWFWNQP